MIESVLTAVLLLAALVAALFMRASTRPSTFAFARTATINAPPERIYPLINDPRVFNTWNPFVLKDPATKFNFRGPAQGKGAITEWAGNRHAGKGTVEVIDAVPPSRIVMRLDMIKPMEARNRVEFTLVPKGDATDVTWAMSGPQPLMAKVMTMFIDCDKMVGGEFEKGLAELKARVEI
jgi:uncharacterized protein YndB with AHSA1/START domain